MKVLIDGDVELYKATTGVEEVFTWEHDFHTIVSDSKEATQLMVEAIEGHKKVVERWIGHPCDLVVAFSSDNNWRKSVYPPYKSHRRIGGRKPLAFAPTKKWFLKNYDCDMRDSLEADDVLGILATSETDDCVIVSIDKDLQSVPSFLYNPDKSREPHLVSLPKADWFHAYQSLMGDKVDGYPGCRQIGTVNARRALGAPGQFPLEDLWKRAWSLYKRSGATWEDMEKQAKCARILRKGEWDEVNQKCLWSVPIAKDLSPPIDSGKNPFAGMVS